MTLQFTNDYNHFVDDLGGFIWTMKGVKSLKWDTMAKLCNVSVPTLRNLANHTTQNPQMYTCWKILKALDHASIIQHSRLEKYRGATKIIPFKRKKAA
jgi:predicted peroxiredoxin